MNTLQERLGVVVEADAARFSGEEFADAWGGDVAGRVKRRRQVRAAAYSGGTMLAAGALVIGGVKLPWGTFAGPAGVGGVDCVTVTPSAAESIVYTETVAIEGGAASWAIPGRELEEATRYTLTYPSDRVERGVTVTSPDGTPLELEFDATGEATFVGEDGRVVVVTLSEGENSILTVVKSNANEVQASPSASADCVTPTPSPAVSAMPSPSPSPSPSTSWSDAQDVSSPFQCGFEFPSSVGSTGPIAVEAVEWFAPEAAEERIRSQYADPEDALLQLSGDPVPVLVFSTTPSWASEREEWILIGGDPAVEGVGLFGTSNDPAATAGLVSGVQFVLESADKVIAVPDFTALPSGVASQYFESNGRASARIYGLDLTVAFAACPGVDQADLAGAQAVAVAGTQGFDADGTIEGPYYAWRFITRD